MILIKNNITENYLEEMNNILIFCDAKYLLCEVYMNYCVDLNFDD